MEKKNIYSDYATLTFHLLFIQGFALPSLSLPPHKLSMWPSCSTALTGEYQQSDKHNLLHLILADVSCHPCIPQWGAADAEIKVPSVEKTELKGSPFKAWSRSAYSHTCYTYCQGFLFCLFIHFRSIHLHFFQNLSRFFPVLAVANTRFLRRPAD